jgi:hypothetical protein
MAATRDRVNALFGSRRLLSQGTIFPSIGREPQASGDRLATMRADYDVFQEEDGPARSNAAYGWIRSRS